MKLGKGKKVLGDRMARELSDQVLTELKLTKVRERTRQSPGRNVFLKRNSERSEAGTGSQVCGTGGGLLSAEQSRLAAGIKHKRD